MCVGTGERASRVPSPAARSLVITVTILDIIVMDHTAGSHLLVFGGLRQPGPMTASWQLLASCSLLAAAWMTASWQLLGSCSQY